MKMEKQIFHSRGGEKTMAKSIYNRNTFKIKTKSNKNSHKFLNGAYYAELEVTIWTGGKQKTEIIQIFRNCIGTVNAIRL
jgi:phage antirepressor YoqD-like protein